MVMMQMTDFTRGTGPLKSTSDVISSATQIAHLGNQLESLASQIAEVRFYDTSIFPTRFRLAQKIGRETS